MARGTGDGYQNGVKDVTGERNPGDVHQREQILEVLQSGGHNVETRGVHPELIQRLQRLHDNVDHGQEHERAQKDKDHRNTGVAARGAGEDDLMLSCS